MKIASRMVVATLALLTLMAAGSKFTWAVPQCPPLCILPPDPAPPLPPINYPDPPLRPLSVINPNSGSTGTGHVGSACQIQNFTGKVTLVNGQYDCDVTPAVGSACPYPNPTYDTGTITFAGGKYACVYTPPAAGSSCQYQDSTGTVAVIKGARYCRISAPGASSAPVAGSTDTIVQRQADAAGSAEARTAQLQATADRAKESIMVSSAEKQALLKAVRSNNTEEAKSLLLKNGFTEKQTRRRLILLRRHYRRQGQC